MRLALFATAAFFLAVPATAAQTVEEVEARIEAVLGDHAKYRAAFDALREAVAADDREAVVALAFYPFVVRMDQRIMIEQPGEFTALYDVIMTDEIVAAIEAQSFESLIVQEQGIGFGNGQVWLAGVCEDEACEQWDVKIITIQSTAEQP